MLTKVRDPGNAGTVLRAADAFGAADAVVTTRGSVAIQEVPRRPGPPPATCSTCRWSPGSALAGTGRALRGRGLRLVEADPHADATVDRAPLGEPVALVLGNEAHGLPAEIAAGLDLVVQTPWPAGPRKA